jgi:hypothetical protein
MLEPWLILRFLEDKHCHDYKSCSLTAAIKDIPYCPCYQCMGGVNLPMNFHCLNCKTTWLEEGNKWMLLKQVTCPLCQAVHTINITLNSQAKPVGTTSRIIGYAKNVKKLDR